MNRWGEIVLLSGIIVFGCVFLTTLRNVPFEAQLFPLIVLAVLLPLSLVRALVVALAKPGGAAASESGTEGRRGAAIQPLASTGPGMPSIAVWAWAVGAATMMLVFGFVWGTGLSVLAYVSTWSRAKWPVSLGVAAIVALFIFVVFGKLMLIDLNVGLVRW